MAEVGHEQGHRTQDRGHRAKLFVVRRCDD